MGKGRLNFTNARLKMESKQKDGGPMGQPRRVKPSSVIGIPAGKEPRSKLASFKTEKRHLLLLRWRPRGDRQYQ